MKKTNWILSLGLGILATACGVPERGPVVLEEGIRFCESTYPYRDGVLVANFGTEELNPLNREGQGYILFFDGEGRGRTLIPADGYLSAPKGMYVRDERLFVCDVNRILVYDLTRIGEAPGIISMPEETELFVNDLVADGDWLYVSVTDADRIYRIDLSDPAHPGNPEPWLSLPGPNGLALYDGAIYVASYPTDGKTADRHVVYRIADPDDPQPEPWLPVPGQYDGIAFAADGSSVYVTNWNPAGIYRTTLEGDSVRAMELGLEQPLVGPADISVAGGKIYIPDLPNSRVVVVEAE